MLSQCAAAGTHAVPAASTAPDQPIPSSSPRVRIAVATLLVSNPVDTCKGGYGCGLLPWCASVQRLRSALAASTLTSSWNVDTLAIVGTRNNTQREDGSAGRSECLRRETFTPADCPGMKFIHPRPALVRATEQHAARVIAGRVMSYNPQYIRRMAIGLYKWELWRLGHSYDAVLYADVDADVMPTYPRAADATLVAREWARRLPALMASTHDGDGGGGGGNVGGGLGGGGNSRRGGGGIGGGDSGKGGGGAESVASAWPDGLHVVGFPDVTSPFGGGLFLVLPPKQVMYMYAHAQPSPSPFVTLALCHPRPQTTSLSPSSNRLSTGVTYIYITYIYKYIHTHIHIHIHIRIHMRIHMHIHMHMHMHMHIHMHIHIHSRLSTGVASRC